MKSYLWCAVCASTLMLGLIFPMAAASAIIFTDNFDSEGGTTSIVNYDSFINWDVFDGSVDLIAQGGFGITCFGSAGKCVDLDGTTRDAARFVTKQSFNLTPGIYELNFAISGSQRSGSVVDTMTVSIGTAYSEVFTKNFSDPFESITRIIQVNSSVSGPITFDHTGGENGGIILDNVNLSAIPIPSAAWLFASGLLGMIGIARRKKAA